MIKIGDKVKFLNDVGGGVVTSFVSKTVVNVEGEDGFEVPVMITELVVVPEEPSYESVRKREQKKTPEKEEPKHVPVIIKGNDVPKFFLAFHPVNQENPIGNEIEVFLINDSNYSVLYHYCIFEENTYKTIDAGELEPNTKSYLSGVTLPDIADNPVHWVRLIPFRKSSSSLSDPIQKELKIDSKKFFKLSAFQKNEFFSDRAMIFKLNEVFGDEDLSRITKNEFKKIVKEKSETKKEQVKKVEKPKELVEIDLHIDALIDSKAGLNPSDILEIQMDRFHSEMEQAIKNKTGRIVFIHGIGGGKLKNEIHKQLKSKYAKYFFQDASFQEYGFGATMVVINRK